MEINETVQLLSGQTQSYIEINVYEDGILETASEKFTLTMRGIGAVCVVVSTSEVDITIIDNDGK